MINILIVVGVGALALGLVWIAGLFERHVAGTAMQFIMAFLGIAAILLIRTGLSQFGEAWLAAIREQSDTNAELRKLLAEERQQRAEIGEALEAIMEQDKA